MAEDTGNDGGTEGGTDGGQSPDGTSTAPESTPDYTSPGDYGDGYGNDGYGGYGGSFDDTFSYVGDHWREPEEEETTSEDWRLKQTIAHYERLGKTSARKYSDKDFDWLEQANRLVKIDRERNSTDENLRDAEYYLMCKAAAVDPDPSSILMKAACFDGFGILVYNGMKQIARILDSIGARSQFFESSLRSQPEHPTSKPGGSGAALRGWRDGLDLNRRW